MSKLLSANFFRLRKSKLFFGITAAIFLGIIGLMLWGADLDAKMQLGRFLDFYYFNTTPYFGFILAAFVSLFVGTEFTDGTIRNKMVVGHTRMSIYFSNLFTCFAAATVFTFAWAIGGFVGIPHFGLWNGGVSAFLLKCIVFYGSLLSMTAIFNLLAHMFSVNKAGGAVFALFFAIVLIIVGNYFVNALYEQEFIYSATISEASGIQYGDLIENPAYIGGSLRRVYEILSYIFPTGQQLWLIDPEYVVKEPFIMTGISLIVLATATTIGYLFFNKKDLK